jgi:hypothetical protein
MNASFPAHHTLRLTKLVESEKLRWGLFFLPEDAPGAGRDSHRGPAGQVDDHAPACGMELVPADGRHTNAQLEVPGKDATMVSETPFAVVYRTRSCRP